MVTLDASDLTLKVGATRGGENTSTVTVAWCLSQRLSNYLQEVGARDPHILLFVSNGRDGYYKPQQFQVVPLDTGLTYIGLRHAGSNIIQATVIWRMDGKARPRQVIENEGIGSLFRWQYPLGNLHERHNQLMEHREKVVPGGNAERKLNEMLVKVNQQIEAVYDEPRQPVLAPYDIDVHHAPVTARVDVDVPKEMFAKEPWIVQKWLADFASPRRKIDQCHSRKYALYGLAKLAGIVLVSPFIAAYWLVIKLISLVLILWFMLRGSRKIGYRALFSWRWVRPDVVWEDIEPSVWWFKKVRSSIEEDPATDHTYTFKPRHPVFLIVNPFVLAIVGLVTWAAVAVSATWAYVLIGAVVIAAIAAIAIMWWYVKRDPSEVKARREAKERARLASELNAVTCGMPQASGVVTGELKPKHQTVHLVFLETKSRVCKPFSE